MNPRTSTLLAPRSVAGLLALAGGFDAFPAAGWVLEGAFELLQHSADPGGPLAEAISRLPAARARVDHRLPGVGAVVRDMVAAGILVPVGQGWSAKYAVDSEWVGRHAALMEDLTTTDRVALATAGQWLVAMATMLSKKAVA